MKITLDVPDALGPALQAAATARGDQNAQAFCARAIREALEGTAQTQVETQKQQDYRAALAAAQAALAAQLKAISAT